jgi:hypothetical protein
MQQYSDVLGKAVELKEYPNVKIVEMPAADCDKLKSVALELLDDWEAELGAEAASLIREAFSL